MSGAGVDDQNSSSSEGSCSSSVNEVLVQIPQLEYFANHVSTSEYFLPVYKCSPLRCGYSQADSVTVLLKLMI